MINANENSYNVGLDLNISNGTELISGKKVNVKGQVSMPPYSVQIIEC